MDRKIKITSLLHHSTITGFRFRICIFIFLIFSSFSSFGQASLANTDPYGAFYEARQWFADGNYGLCYPVFKSIEQQMKDGTLTDRQLQYDEVLFYNIACQLMQGNIAAEKNAKDYLNGNNQSVFKGQLSYYLGLYYFYRQDYVSASESFALAQPAGLSSEQASEFSFLQGYSLFTQKKLKEAKPFLDQARNNPKGKNYVEANYYYGLIAFGEGQYRDAISSFEIAGQYPEYKSLAPYYTSSIQYALGNKDKGLELALKALAQGDQYYETELNQLVGHAYFEKGDFNKALPYLEKYINRSLKVTPEELYELAFCYYAQKNWPKAIDGFKPLSGGKDTLSQYAMYLLGDTYLQVDDKANAKTAFIYCAQNSSNKIIRENSLLQVGKLALDLGLDNEATISLKKFLADYPGSKNTGEARDLLVSALANTSNYKEALTLYESLKDKSITSQKVLPGILFNRSQEELADKRWQQAEVLIDRGLKTPYNQDYLPLFSFWKAELLFDKKEYSQALSLFNEYLGNPKINGEANPVNAAYSKGYCYLMLEQYGPAQKEFEGLAKGTVANSQVKADIQIRLADACYMQKNFAKAKPIYQAETEKAGPYADYAYYQLGLIAGAENKPDQKIAYMQNLEKLYPNSILVQTANMEIAKAFLADEKYKDALPWLAKIISAKGSDGLKPEALLKQGLAYYNLENNSEALNSFRNLLSRYPDSEEAEEAIDNVRSIYIEQGKPNEFIVFMNKAGRALETSTADSLTYVAAEIQLSEGKNDAALNSFLDYIKRYPEGRYTIQANWNAAELYRLKKNVKGAVPYYESVAEKSPNKYAEDALLYVARFYYFDEKDFKKAIEYYQQLKIQAGSQEKQLEAMRGLLRSKYYSGAYADAQQDATELLQQRGIGNDDKTFANLVLGKNAQQANNFTEAIRYYQQVANLNNAEYGAEARYSIAVCLFQQQSLSEAENAAFDVIKKSGSYVEWVTKSYMLLGDIYFKQKDYFNAKATYKSIAENASLESLKQEAVTKLALVEKEEKEQSKIGQ